MYNTQTLRIQTTLTSNTLEKMRKNGVTAVNVIETTEYYWKATVIQGHNQNEIIKCHTVL